MYEKLSPQLVRWLDACPDDSTSSEEVSVIVTLCQGTDPGGLAKLGLRLEHRYEAIPAVSGKARPEVLRALVKLEGVEAVEADGAMEAL